MEEEQQNKMLKMTIYNDLRKTIEDMYKEARLKVQNNIEMGQNPRGRKLQMSEQSNAHHTPSPVDKNSSFMSKVQSAIEDKSEFVIDEKSPLMNDQDMKNTFFIERKAAIIDEWKKKVFREKSKKLKNKHKNHNAKSRNIHGLDGNSASSPGGNDSSPIQDEEDTQVHATDEELTIANEFLDKFLIQSEATIDGHIDLNLVLKAIPNKIKPYMLDRIELFNFIIFQDSLIAHQNTEIVDAFEHFDQRNKDRVYSIKEKLLGQKKELGLIREILSSVQNLNTSQQRATSADGERKGLRKKINFDEGSRSDFKRLGLRKMSSNDDLDKSYD